MYGYRCNMHIRNTVVCDASKGSLISKPPNAFPLTEFVLFFCFFFLFVFFFLGGGGGGRGRFTLHFVSLLFVFKGSTSKRKRRYEA